MSEILSDSKYDPNSGNHDNWNRNIDGSTNVRGFNDRTGSQWNSTIQPNGDQRGTDSRGNMWNDNKGTGRDADLVLSLPRR